MILVIGASGHVGRAAVKDLAAVGVPVRAFTRDEANVPAHDGVEIVLGDLDNPETVSFALRDVEQVLLLVATNTVSAHEAMVIARAEDAGVRHVLMVSSLGVETGVGSGPAHRGGEEALRASSLAWTILRPVAYMTNALRWHNTIISAGEFYEPTGNGKYPMIDPRDIGSVAARVLMSPEHQHDVLRLTGPEALSSAEYAEKLSAAVGRPIRHVDIPEEAFRDAMLRAGVPPAVLDPVTAFYAQIKAGEAAEVTPEVTRILGESRTFDAWARENAAAFS